MEDAGLDAIHLFDDLLPEHLIRSTESIQGTLFKHDNPVTVACREVEVMQGDQNRDILLYARFRATSITSIWCRTSRLLVGSSIRMTGVSWTIARAIITRWRSPPGELFYLPEGKFLNPPSIFIA